MPFRPLLFTTALLTCLLASCLPAGLSAQADSIGTWRSLQSFRNGSYVTQSEHSIIYTTGRAIFYLDKEDLSITTLSKEQGLAEANIRLVRYHQPSETLVIVYESGVIDLLQDRRFFTLRQIDNFNFSGDKRINDIFFGEDNVAYISAGFGLTAFDLVERIFVFTTFTGVPVNASAIQEGYLYLATDEGIYRALRQNTNLSDFGGWELLGPSTGLPGDYTSTVINTYRGRLYFGVDKDIYRLVGTDTSELFFAADPNRDYRIQYLTAEGSELIAGYRCQDEICADRLFAYFNEHGLLATSRSGCAFQPNYAVQDEQGRTWLGEADPVSQIRYFPAPGQECNTLEYPGPYSDATYSLLHDGSSLWAAPGVRSAIFTPQFDFNGAYRYQAGHWDAFNLSNTDAFLGQDGVQGGDDDVATIVSVDYDPVNKLHYFSSFFEGVIAFDESTRTGTLYDETNSSLSLSNGAGPGRVRVAGAATDPAGYTYFANNGAIDDNIIAVRAPDGTWADLGGACNANRAQDITIDAAGYVWVLHASSVGGAITVLDVAGTPLDPSDDRCRTITPANSSLPTSNVRSLAVDLDGAVWVGTTKGIIIFECGADVFNAERCRGTLPVATADDFGAYLLATEEVLAVTVDGGNRKWIGTTQGGVYLLSPDGREQLLNFNAGNSPLLDNTVRDIAIDGANGTVYFGTERGISSFRAEATAAENTFRGELTVFPNPVEPGYDGPIAIQGLARDARVKITDVSGKIVDQGTAIGGQYLWNGADYTGRRVQSGVYLVFASSNFRFTTSDPQAAIGKIVFIH